MPELTIQSIDEVTDRVRHFSLSDPAGDTLPGYTAGAHIEIKTVDDMPRAYSLIDFTPPAAAPSTYRIAVQREADGEGGSRYMHTLNVGGTVHCSEPANSFSLIDDERPVLLLAGGIGITPLISMATALSHSGRTFNLHYSGRTASAMAFRDRLSDQLGEQLQLYVDDVDPERLNLDALFSQCSGAEHVYICGPKGMIDAAKICCENIGLPGSQVHIELFDTPASNADDSEFEVELKSSGQVLLVPKDKSIIDVLEDAGIDALYDCQRGDCGICQTTVIEGEIDHRDVVLSSDEKARGDVMQICVSRAKSARLVLDL